MSQTEAAAHPHLQTQSKPFDLHVFVCTNKKPEGKACCADKGADQILQQLKAWEKTARESRSTQDQPLKFRISKSGCLGFCSKGTAIAIYPDSEFLLGLGATEHDITTVVACLEEKLNHLATRSEA